MVSELKRLVQYRLNSREPEMTVRTEELVTLLDERARLIEVLKAARGVQIPTTELFDALVEAGDIEAEG